MRLYLEEEIIFMITLSASETIEYNKVLKNIAGLPRGHYYARDFFINSAVSPRIVRKLYEEVKTGNIQQIRLSGSKSEDGYILY